MRLWLGHPCANALLMATTDSELTSRLLWIVDVVGPFRIKKRDGDGDQGSKRSAHYARLKFWRYGVRNSPVADSLEEAGDRLFTFTQLPASQWKSARTINAIQRLHEEFKQRIKTQTVLPSSDTATMLFWALLASS